MRTILYHISLLFIVFSCTTDDMAHIVKLKGYKPAFRDKEISLFYLEDGIMKGRNLQFDSTGYFHQGINLKSSTIGLLEIGRKKYMIPLFIGREITITNERKGVTQIFIDGIQEHYLNSKESLLQDLFIECIGTNNAENASECVLKRIKKVAEAAKINYEENGLSKEEQEILYSTLMDDACLKALNVSMQLSEEEIKWLMDGLLEKNIENGWSIAGIRSLHSILTVLSRKMFDEIVLNRNKYFQLIENELDDEHLIKLVEAIELLLHPNSFSSEELSFFLKNKCEAICDDDFKRIVHQKLNVYPYKRGERMYDFKGQSVSEDELFTGDIKNKNIYLYFWASWCNPCIRKLKLLAEVLNEDEASNWKLIAVSIDEDKTKWQQLASQTVYQDAYGNIVHILPDDIPSVKEAYQIEGISRSIFIRTDRHIEQLDVKVVGEFEKLKKRLRKVFYVSPKQ